MLGDPRLPPRFWNKVNDSDAGCWLWIAARTRAGYGHLRFGPKDRLAHRVAYETLVGPIPDGLQIDHLCRVRNCVNPAHLEPVTNAENGRRGIASAVVTARHRAQTHCKHGHPYDESNTRVKRDGARDCRTCAAQRLIEHRAARRAAGLCWSCNAAAAPGRVSCEFHLLKSRR